MDDARTGQPEIGRDEQSLQLDVTLIAEREHGPVGVGAGIERDHLDTPDKPVLAGCGADLDAPLLAGEDINSGLQVYRIDSFGNRDNLERPARPSHPQHRHEQGKGKQK